MIDEDFDTESDEPDQNALNTISPTDAPQSPTNYAPQINAVAQAAKQIAAIPRQTPMPPGQYGPQMAPTAMQQVPSLPNPVVGTPLQQQYPGIAQHITKVTTNQGTIQ